MPHDTKAAVAGRDEGAKQKTHPHHGIFGRPVWEFLNTGLAIFFLGTSLFGLLSVSAQSPATVMLAWDPSPDSNVVGYFRYYGSASGTYTNIVDVGPATSTSVSGLLHGSTYYFAVTAYNSIGLQSLPSSELPYTVPPDTNGLVAPAILSQPTNQTVLVGANASLQLTASGTAPLSYQWLFNGANLPGAT